MRQGHVPLARVQAVLLSLNRRRRLAGLVRTFVQEIERLDEENVRLRVAIAVSRKAGPRL